VGRTGEKYTIFLGGSTLGTRLSVVFQDLVPRDQIVPLVKTVLTHFKEGRQGSESFGDYCHRMGNAKLCEMAGVALPKH
jgi:sulfite reductase (ferredoxin)